ncbi:hypothetical protein WMW72_29620 [Paenibacillus filicis]|uniref:ATP-dependent dethiobiotin synthetase BioD n=1 Tax=Paenibacillus filicis TaxID=669464 RepID=A0ABU9DVB1_9BACL
MNQVNMETIRGLFVTGTDTGVRKTVVTAAITRRCSRKELAQELHVM